ncbi:MAG: PLP-dependent aminotransferase family protein [Verrucomicrobiales bacterium]
MDWNDKFADRTREMRRSTVREVLKLTQQPGMISFGGGLPAPELFPIREMEIAAATVLKDHGPVALQYSSTEGHPELRDWIAKKFSGKDLNLSRENVLIVSGSQQGIDLIGRVFLNIGDLIMVENPTYLAMLAAFRPFGATFQAVGSDEDGMKVEELLNEGKSDAKLLYITPDFQNPQGTTLSLERRRALIDWVRQQGVPLVEDNPYGELRYEGTSLPHLLTLAAEDGTGPNPVIYLGTFSKVLAPGLRVGWVIAAPEVIEKLVLAKQAADLHTSSMTQHMVVELLKNGVIESQIPKVVAAYRSRRDCMLAALAKHMPQGVSWTKPAGGMFLMVSLPGQLEARELLSMAVKEKVAFVPGEDFYVDGAVHNTFRLNFSNASEDLIEKGITRLSAAVKQLMSQVHVG